MVKKIACDAVPSKMSLVDLVDEYLVFNGYKVNWSNDEVAVISGKDEYGVSEVLILSLHDGEVYSNLIATNETELLTPLGVYHHPSSGGFSTIDEAIAWAKAQIEGVV